MTTPSTPEQPGKDHRDDPANSLARALLGEVDFVTPPVARPDDSRRGTLDDPAFDGMPKSLASLLLLGHRGNHGPGNWPV